MGKCIIMCAGDFREKALAVGEEDFLIAADNGLTYLTRLGIRPDYVIGDYDSLSPEGQRVLKDFEAKHRDKVEHLPVMKDDTDTMAAVRVGLARGYLDFEIHAALGGRLDHSLANIQTLSFLRSQGARGWIRDVEVAMTVASQETICFPADVWKSFSIFSLHEETKDVTLEGFKYEVRGASLRGDYPIGVSNSFLKGREARVEVGEGSALIYVSCQEH